jgi:hypothetical protein
VSYANGQIPLSVLTPVHPFGHLLHDAAIAYEDMRIAALHDGVVLRPEGPDASTYRSEHWQVYYRRYWCAKGMCYRAAVTGTSNHGRGDAVDFHMGPGVYAWLVKHAHSYGFSHAEGARVGEVWHWVYIGGYQRRRDPLWYLTARERRLVREYQHLSAIKHPTKTQAKRRKEVWHWLRDQRGRIYTQARREGGWHSARSSHAHRLARYRLLYRITR